MRIVRPPDPGQTGPSGIAFGQWIFAKVDLSTAAHVNGETWARYGKAKLFVGRQRGQGWQVDTPNNRILAGAPVLRFLSTGAGLVAIGDGAVGIVAK